jgi:TRAP transporter TAXI family solute receptor
MVMAERGSGRRAAWAGVAACATLFAAGCRGGVPAQAIDAAPRQILLTTGPSTGAYSPLGKALADVYNAKLSGVHVTAKNTDGPRGAGENAQLLEDGKADLGFSRADIAYQLYRQSSEGEQSTSHLRSIAVLYTNAVHVVVRRASGIARGEDMRGHRVQVSDESFGAGSLARFVLDAYGLKTGDVTIVASPRNAIARLKAGELDVRIFASAYPLAGIDDVGPSSDVALLSLTPEVIDRLRSRYSFFKPAVIPKGTYRGQDADVQTVGIDGLLLCRDTMPEDLVYSFTKTLFSAIPELSPTHFARLIDASNAPATPVPLHPGAARYYRERDLFR